MLYATIALHVFFLLSLIAISIKKPYWFGYSEDRLFTPIKVYIVLALIGVPHMLMIANKPEEVIYTTINFKIIDELLVKYILLFDAGIILFILGGLSNISFLSTAILKLFQKEKFTINIKGFYILLFFYFFIFYRNISQLNLATSIFSIFYERGDNYQKIGYFYLFQQVLASFVYYNFIKLKPQIKHFWGFQIFIFSIFALLGTLLLGGRTSILYLVIFVTFTVDVISLKLSLKSFLRKDIILGFSFIALLFIIIPILRTPSNTEAGIDGIDKIDYSNELSNSSSSVVADLSGLDRYLFILDVFSSEERLWEGQSYLDLLKIINPFIDKTTRPPGDDGTYLSTISYKEIYMRPPAKPSELNRISYPSGNFTMYMNFGFIGYLLGIYLLGIIIKILYNLALMKQFNYIFLYNTFISGSIGLSNLGVLAFILNIYTLILLFILCIIVTLLTN